MSEYTTFKLRLTIRFRARKYSKYVKTWHEASTSGYCSRELKRNSKVAYCSQYLLVEPGSEAALWVLECLEPGSAVVEFLAEGEPGSMVLRGRYLIQ